MALLVRFEAFPEYFTRTMPGYRSLLSDDVLLEDSWSRILHQGQPIGYSHTELAIDQANPLQHYALQSHVFVRLKALGTEQRIDVDTVAHVDVTHRLQRFSFTLSTRDTRMEISGRRGEGSHFAVTMKSALNTQTLDVEIPDDVILYSPMTEMALKRLRPGGELTMRTFDPASLSPSRMTVRALREEPFERQGATQTVTVLETEYQGMAVHSWLAKDGTLLRQDTPLGWSIESCTADEALATIRQSRGGGDMLADVAVPVIGTIHRPASCRLLRLRLSGVSFKPRELETNRQSIDVAGEKDVVLRVRRGRFPRGAGGARELGKAERAAALAATAFVQSDAPEMVAMAERVVGGLTNDAERVKALTHWVNASVRKEMTVSLPSALDVLKTMAGDCNEHTYLFTALARAVGIPAKIMVGLAYHEGAFYYHAWPAAYVGEWVEVDPTWGQEVVDATHIRMVEGEISQQMDIIKLVGRLRITVLEEAE